MKKALLLTLFCCILATPAGARNLDQHANESRAAVKEFMGSLKGQLKAALKEGGPVKALNVCNTSAPAIAMVQSKKHGWKIGRTSLKLRNPDNAPDAWEKAVLEKFEARKTAGEDPKKIEHYEVVTQDGKQLFRYMKAIPTAEKPCLACHGEKIQPKVLETLDKLYPQDQARGFKAGDIRGAFTITQPM
ncbi:Cytochrome c family protein [hydrothermal vent metagenome]|uniref:Cytochrome c family protein n=1 Tax=hydrothermal vent metagenome TaxID=652676 RepID=A0A3B1BAV6_9ZZZZ